jgi:hypothetical protein
VVVSSTVVGGVHGAVVVVVVVVVDVGGGFDGWHATAMKNATALPTTSAPTRLFSTAHRPLLVRPGAREYET